MDTNQPLTGSYPPGVIGVVHVLMTNINNDKNITYASADIAKVINYWTNIYPDGDVLDMLMDKDIYLKDHYTPREINEIRKYMYGEHIYSTYIH